MSITLLSTFKFEDNKQPTKNVTVATQKTNCYDII